MIGSFDSNASSHRDGPLASGSNANTRQPLASQGWW